MKFQLTVNLFFKSLAKSDANEYSHKLTISVSICGEIRGRDGSEVEITAVGGGSGGGGVVNSQEQERITSFRRALWSHFSNASALALTAISLGGGGVPRKNGAQISSQSGGGTGLTVWHHVWHHGTGAPRRPWRERGTTEKSK